MCTNFAWRMRIFRPAIIEDAMLLIGVDGSLPFVLQGYQLLAAAVGAIVDIGAVIEAKW